jgi:hypothetical protein
MSHLTVVNAAYQSTVKQPTHFLVVDAGLTYVNDGDILTLKYAAQLMRDCHHVAAEYNPVLVPYTPPAKTKRQLKK